MPCVGLQEPILQHNKQTHCSYDLGCIELCAEKLGIWGDSVRHIVISVGRGSYLKAV